MAVVLIASPFAVAALADPPGEHAPLAPAAAPQSVTQDQQKALRERDLEAIRQEQRQAAETEAKLRAEIDAISEDRGKLNAALIETAARVRVLETRIAASEGRISGLDSNARTIRSSLDERRGVIAEILAALQRIGRRPPPALMVRPEDALQAVRTAMLLGAVLPEMRVEAEALVDDLTELARVRREIAAELETASRDLAALSQDRQRMTLLVEERQKRQADTERALQAERERAAELARTADSLKDLLAKLEHDGAASGAERRDRSSRRKGRQGESRRPQGSGPTGSGDRVCGRQGRAAATGQRGQNSRVRGSRPARRYRKRHSPSPHGRGPRSPRRATVGWSIPGRSVPTVNS